MARLADIRRQLEESSEASGALAQLAEFTTIVTVGTTISGGALTLPLMIAESGKAASALFKLAKLFLSDKSPAADAEPAQRADQIFYLFAHRAFLQALRRMGDSAPKARLDSEKYRRLLRELERTTPKPENSDASFHFGWTTASGPLQLFESYKAWMTPMLVAMGADTKAVTEWMKNLEAEARKNLFRELSSTKDDRQWMVNYQLLVNTATTIDLLKAFAAPTADPGDAAWKDYLENLAAKPTLPIWGEEEKGISIARLFVEASYSYTRQLPAGPIGGNPAEFTGLRAFLSGLLSRRTPSTELVFVMGGPGTGKTSLLEVLCGELASAASVPIVLVPAKRLDPDKALLPEAQRYLRDSGFGSIAELFPSTKDCILAIDGFDELAHATLSTLQTFFRSAQELVRERSGTRLRILLSGRPTLFAHNDVAIPSGAHIVSLKPFDKMQVEQWSANWQSAAGGSFDGLMYFKSKNKDIHELSTQPMLLYLLAKMHQQDQPVPVDPPNTGGVRFKVYVQILDWVCSRQESKRSPNETVRLRRFLQVAGLATHLSGRRILHWNDFKKALEQAGLADQKEVDAKAHSTILSFAFTSAQQQSWEFTHKSFGEVLAAEAIGRFLEDVSESGRSGERWRVSLPDAVKGWVQTFGPHFLTKDLLDFCTGWLQVYGPDFCKRVAPRLVDILNFLLGVTASEQVFIVARATERPVHAVLGNACRSWFALTNATLGIVIGRGDAQYLDQWAGEIEQEQFRTAVLLSHLASPITFGEARTLFLHSSSLLKGRKRRPSKRYQSDLLPLLQTAPASRSVRTLPTLLRNWSAHSLVPWEPNESLKTFDIPVEGPWYRRLRFSLPAPPIEDIFSELEDSIQRGYESNPKADARALAGSDDPRRLQRAALDLLGLTFLDLPLEEKPAASPAEPKGGDESTE